MALPYAPYKRNSQQLPSSASSPAPSATQQQRSSTPPPVVTLAQLQAQTQTPSTGKSVVVDPSTSSLDRFPRSPPPEPSSGAFSTAQRSRLIEQQPARSHGGTNRTPYMPGFQPAGVYRARTEEFIDLRMKHGEGRRLEYGRIARRLEKLVQLHFLNSAPTTSVIPPGGPKLASLTQSVIKSRSISASELWSTVRQSVKTDQQRRADELRQAEQKIVHWQDDKAVLNCPICL